MSRKGERYSKLYESFWRSPKFTGRSLAASGLYAKCLSVTRDVHRDGHVPKFMIGALCASDPVGESALSELLDPLPGEDNPPLVDVGDEYFIHDWTEDNETESELAKRRESERKKKQRQRGVPSRGKASPRRVPGDVPGDIPRDRGGGRQGGTGGGKSRGTSSRDTDTYTDRSPPPPSRGEDEGAASTSEQMLPWARVCRIFDEQWEAEHGVALGLHGGSNGMRRGTQAYQWAVDTDPERWQEVVRLSAAEAAQDPELDKARSPFAVWAASPGKWLARALERIGADPKSIREARRAQG